MIYIITLIGCCTILAPLVLFKSTKGSKSSIASFVIVALISLFNLLILPNGIDSFVSTIVKVIVIFLYGWLATFKSIGIVLHRGPLCYCTGNLAHFILVYNLPITPVWRHAPIKGNARQHESKEHSVAGWFLQLGTKVTLLLCVTGISARIEQYYTGSQREMLDYYNDITPLMQCLAELCDALALYAFIGVIMNISSFILHCLPYGMSIKNIAPHYDMPWMSHSITNFWSLRWNLNTGYTLRFLVYDPICEGRCVAPLVQPHMRPNRVRRAFAMCTSFLVSGLMHELFIFHMRSRVSGYWLAYFAAQGPLILLVDELLGLKRLATRNTILARLLTLLLQLGVAHILFFPDIIRMGIPREIHGNVRSIFGLILPEKVYQLVYS